MLKYTAKRQLRKPQSLESETFLLWPQLKILLFWPQKTPIKYDVLHIEISKTEQYNSCISAFMNSITDDIIQ